MAPIGPSRALKIGKTNDSHTNQKNDIISRDGKKEPVGLGRIYRRVLLRIELVNDRGERVDIWVVELLEEVSQAGR